MRLAFFLSLSLGCTLRPVSPVPTSARPSLRVSNPSARLNRDGDGTAYLSVLNAGPTPDRLRSVSSPLAAEVSLHDLQLDGDVVRMIDAPDGWVLPAGEPLVLGPGGKHLMLTGVRLPPNATALPLELHFDHAPTLSIRVPLQGPAPMQGATKS